MQSSTKLPPIKNIPVQKPDLINHKSLALIKKGRKQAEEDAKLLANRIALLKQEEIKTGKKIEETKAKALEIYKLKLQNEEKHKKVHEFFLIFFQFFNFFL